ncbi:uncharacterized protein CMU_016630 [Cryptosporidium muris RN66]|uniref:Translation initiation factor eIF2B subunit epsilon n=1 Tax=Cryptosporidium muris (strain RN66) TaxID=441375 RepID=B6ACQ9_CRYMR|nr:uncharacterized protein CMU_016630 [Cryptosporidium muris RN66]EEA05913.1 hypothetical protein, conserved [Cryptosporidium muris RN66]|eukprot:XP_002140262.1 hypothetical protein [Cryptosporidium muris RN66]
MDKKGAKGRNEDTNFVCLPAVVLVETLEEDSFSPISCEFPATLLPINGVAILNYVVEMLSRNGVTDAYLLVRDHINLVSNHIETLINANKKLKSLNLHIVHLGLHCNSLGDILRELECQVDLRDDFILVRGDLFTVADIREHISAHKKKRLSGLNVAMTIIFAECPPLSTLRTTATECVVAYDVIDNELVFWGEFSKSLDISLDLSLYRRNSKSGNTKIRYDLLDVGISICSPQLLKDFCETFDYNNIQHDYVRNVLTSDIKQEEVHIAILSQYAVRIRDFRTYHAALQHVCEGWAFPVVPDYCSIAGQTIQRCENKSVFLGNAVVINPNSDLGPMVSIGENTTIGSHVVIENSFIGPNCKIGDHCTIKGCILLSNVTIGDYSSVQSTFISNNVTIHSNVLIMPCCVLGSNVSIGSSKVIESFSKISTFTSGKVISEINSPVIKGYHLASKDELEKLGIGPNCLGILWPCDHNMIHQQQYALGGDALSSIILFESNVCRDINREINLNTDSEGDSEDSLHTQVAEQDIEQDLKEFRHEVISLVKSGLLTPIHIPNKILELKGLRFAFFKDDLDVLDCLLPVVLMYLADNSHEFLLDRKRINFEDFLSFVKHCGIYDLFSAFCRPDELNFTYSVCDAILNFCSNNETLNFGSLLVAFEKCGFINQDLIPNWYDFSLKINEDNQKQEALDILKSDFVCRYIKWIREDDNSGDD